MTSSKSTSFQLSENHPFTQLFASSPLLQSMPAVRAFLDEMGRRFGKKIKMAAHFDRFPTDASSIARGAMIAETLSVTNLFIAARAAVSAIPGTPNKTAEARLNDFDVAACSLFYGIYRVSFASPRTAKVENVNTDKNLVALPTVHISPEVLAMLKLENERIAA